MKKILFFILVVCCSNVITVAQNVGIGTPIPQDKLHVNGGNSTIENNNTNYPWLSFRNSGVLKGYIGVSNNDLRIGTWPGFNTTGHIALVTNAIDRMRIMQNGDVGIGVLAPLSKLHVANNAGATEFILGTNHLSGGFTSLYMGTSALTNGYSYLQSVKTAGTAFGDLSLNPNAGNVGIRTTTPRGIFDIGGGDEDVYIASNTTTGNQRIAYMPGNIFMVPWAGTDVAYLDARRNPKSGNLGLQIRTTSSSILTNAVYISPDGRVGIGNSDPKADLDIGDGINDGKVMIRRGNSNQARVLASSGTSVIGSDPNTALQFNSYDFNTGITFLPAWVSWDGNYFNSSDKKLKENINGLQKVLPSVLQLNPVTYNYINIKNAKTKNIGFIAQDVESYFPELVSMVSDNKGAELKGINYSGFGVIAIKAIQEQQKIIDDLQSQINELKLQIQKTAI